MITGGNRIGLQQKPGFVDLFCGAGLLSHAFKSCGFEPQYAIDLDKKAIASYRRNVSECAEVSDVSKVATGLSADVLIAGPPCQGFSTLGRRDPKDARNGLGLHIIDWAKSLLPKVVVIENVPGFVKTAWFRKLSKGLESQGYSINVLILKATDYGTAQKRTRAFTIATRIGPVHIPVPGRSPARNFRDAVESRPLRSDDPMHIWPKPTDLAFNRFVAIPPMGGKKELMLNRPDLCPSSWSRIPGEATDVWGRINPDIPTNTIRCSFQSPSKGRYIHPDENRSISLREGARLQGIPDSWMMHGKPGPIARQIGNGVPIPLGKAVAKSVMRTFIENDFSGNLIKTSEPEIVDGCSADESIESRFFPESGADESIIRSH